MSKLIEVEDKNYVVALKALLAARISYSAPAFAEESLKEWKAVAKQERKRADEWEKEAKKLI